jgi:flagellar basal-body rod protein FlgG
VNRTLSVAAAGMAVQQNLLDTISVNLANVDVPGFRVSRADFAPFLAADGRLLAPLRQSEQRLFSQGRLDFTDNPNDLAIEGSGFFAVRTATGARAYTRAGNFTPDASGRLRLPNGAALEGVRLPPGSTSFVIEDAGRVLTRVVGRTAAVRGGTIALASFANPPGLRLQSDGLFYATAQSGPPRTGVPGAALGHVKQRTLERANIAVIAAMMAVLTAQRAYEANAKAVQAADEMLRLANNLERN